MTEHNRHRLLLIVPLALFLAAAVGYTLMWNKAAQRVEIELARFAEAEAEAGRSLTYEDIKVKGYPFSLRGQINSVRWERPGLGSYTVEELLFVTLPYDPSRVILTPRGAQTLDAFGAPYAVSANDLRFSVERGMVAVETSSLLLDGEDQDITISNLIGNLQSLSGASTIAVMVRQAAVESSHPYTVPYFDLAASRDGDTFTIAGLTLGVAHETERPPTQLGGDGQVMFSEDGLASGELELRLKNQDPLIDVLVSHEVLDGSIAKLVKPWLASMSESGTKEFTLPLTMREGDIQLGFFTLGSLPPLRD